MYGDGNLIDQESYFNYRLANTIYNHGFVHYDPLSFSGRTSYYEYGFPYLLSFSPMLFSWIIPFLFGLGSFVLFYIILKRYDSDIALLSSIFLIASPTFIYLFSVSTKFCGAVFFILLGIYFYLEFIKHETNYYKYFSLISFLIVSFFSIEFAILLIIVGLIFAYKNKISWRFYLIEVSLSLGILYLEFRRLLIDFGTLFVGLISTGDLLTRFNSLFSDLGGHYGIGMFLFILALIGIYGIWSAKYRYLVVYLLLGVLLWIAMYFSCLLFLINFIIVILAGYGAIYILDSEWKNFSFRYLTLLVILCGILFSMFSFFNHAVDFEPSANYIDAVKHLQGLQGNGVTFSDTSRGLYILLGNKKDVTDLNLLDAPNLTERMQDTQTLLHTYNLEVAKKIIDKYKIDYIWIDKEMKNKLYVDEQSELLFLLKYSRTEFFKDYSNDDVEIWGVF
jgi:hypothetical protein